MNADLNKGRVKSARAHSLPAALGMLHASVLSTWATLTSAVSVLTTHLCALCDLCGGILRFGTEGRVTTEVTESTEKARVGDGIMNANRNSRRVKSVRAHSLPAALGMLHASAFGPWGTMISAASINRLGTFWKRRMTMLPATKAAGTEAPLRSALMLVFCGACLLALPTFVRRGADAAEQTRDDESAARPVDATTNTEPVEIALGTDEAPPNVEKPARDSIELVIGVAGDERFNVSTTIDLADDRQAWKPPATMTLPFVELHNIRFQRRTAKDDALSIIPTFKFLGAENPDRHILAELRAVDAAGHRLFHTWWVHEDNRIGPREQQVGSRTATLAVTNSSRLEVPQAIVATAHHLELRFRELYPKDLVHFARKPHKLKLALTHPNPAGDQEMAFTNPSGWDLAPDKHEIAVVINLKDGEGHHAGRRITYIPYRAEGQYRLPLQVPPEQFDQSSIGISIFTKQPDNDAFKRDFFETGKGSAYRGIWTGDGGRFADLPYDDSEYR